MLWHLTICFGILARSSIETRVGMAGVGLLQLASLSTSEGGTQTVERVPLLKTLSAFHARIRKTRILLTVASFAAEFVRTVA